MYVTLYYLTYLNVYTTFVLYALQNVPKYYVSWNVNTIFITLLSKETILIYPSNGL